MNRRDFLKSTALLAAVPYIPIERLDKLWVPRKTDHWVYGGSYVRGNQSLEIVASSADIGPFKYAVLIDDYGNHNGDLIGWYDYGEPITLKDGEEISYAPARWVNV